MRAFRAEKAAPAPFSVHVLFWLVAALVIFNLVLFAKFVISGSKPPPTAQQNPSQSTSR